MVKQDVISPTLLRILDNLAVCPAYVLDQRFNLLAWNRSASVIFGDFSQKNKCWWPDYDVEGIAEGEVEFNHTEFGYLKFDHITFEVSGTPT